MFLTGSATAAGGVGPLARKVTKKDLTLDDGQLPCYTHHDFRPETRNLASFFGIFPTSVCLPDAPRWLINSQMYMPTRLREKIARGLRAGQPPLELAQQLWLSLSAIAEVIVDLRVPHDAANDFSQSSPSIGVRIAASPWL